MFRNELSQFIILDLVEFLLEINDGIIVEEPRFLARMHLGCIIEIIAEE